MTRLEVEPGAHVAWLPLSLLGGKTQHAYLARVEEVRRRRVVVNLGRVRAQVPAGDLQEVEHGTR